MVDALFNQEPALTGCGQKSWGPFQHFKVLQLPFNISHTFTRLADSYLQFKHISCPESVYTLFLKGISLDLGNYDEISPHFRLPSAQVRHNIKRRGSDNADSASLGCGAAWPCLESPSLTNKVSSQPIPGSQDDGEPRLQAQLIKHPLADANIIPSLALEWK